MLSHYKVVTDCGDNAKSAKISIYLEKDVIQMHYILHFI